MQQELIFLKRANQTVGKPSGKERGPKPIAGSSEVMANRRRIKTMIDPAEEDLKSMFDQIGYLLARRILDLFFAGFERLLHHPVAGNPFIAGTRALQREIYR